MFCQVYRYHNISQPAFLVTQFWKVLFHSLTRRRALQGSMHQNLNHTFKERIALYYGYLFKSCQVLGSTCTLINFPVKILTHCEIIQYHFIVGIYIYIFFKYIFFPKNSHTEQTFNQNTHTYTLTVMEKTHLNVLFSGYLSAWQKKFK